MWVCRRDDLFAFLLQKNGITLYKLLYHMLVSLGMMLRARHAEPYLPREIAVKMASGNSHQALRTGHGKQSVLRSVTVICL